MRSRLMIPWWETWARLPPIRPDGAGSWLGAIMTSRDRSPLDVPSRFLDSRDALAPVAAAFSAGACDASRSAGPAGAGHWRRGSRVERNRNSLRALLLSARGARRRE